MDHEEQKGHSKPKEQLNPNMGRKALVQLRRWGVFIGISRVVLWEVNWGTVHRLMCGQDVKWGNADGAMQGQCKQSRRVDQGALGSTEQPPLRTDWIWGCEQGGSMGSL